MSRKQAEYDVVQLTKSLPSPTFITLPHAEGICRARALPDSVGGGKNLVLVLDGTGNTFGPMLTSMPKLFSYLLADSEKQLMYYQSGIGTYGSTVFSPFGIVKRAEKLLDEAIAIDLKQHVIDAYAFCSNYYSPGDRIYILGFSRGAYTARALAGMLQQVGLVTPGNEQSHSLAFEIYAKGADTTIDTARDVKLAAAFKRSFAMTVNVHFVGVWDTVASVGALVARSNLPFSGGSSFVKHFRQALSLDERRIRFSPQPYMPAPPLPDELGHPEKPVSEQNKPSVKEVWFSGSHSNVGGGASATDLDRTPDLAHLPLRWMVREALERGLTFDIHAVEASAVFIPFLAEAQSRLTSTPPDPDLTAYLSSPSNDFAQGTDPALIALVYVSTLPPSRFSPSSEAYKASHGAACAPRSDPLSPTSLWSIYPSTSPTLPAKISAFIINALAWTLWWTLELALPALQVVWDVEGHYRSRSWRINAGRARQLTSGQPTWHWSVRERMNASGSELDEASHNMPGSVRESWSSRSRTRAGQGQSGSYQPAAAFSKGQSMSDVRWDEGQW